MPMTISASFLNQINPFHRAAGVPPYLDFQNFRGKTPEEINALWNDHLDHVKEAIKTAPAAARRELEPIFQSLSFESIQKFFDHLVKNEESIPEGLYDYIPWSVICKEQSRLEEWAQELNETLCEEQENVDPTASFGKARTSVVTHFFPNLAHVFMRSFTLLQGERPPDTLYEYGVLVTMYFNFFQIPYVLFTSLHTVIPNPWVCWAAGTLILGIAVGLLYTYLRWFRGCPSRIIHCDNWSEKRPENELTRVLGREDEYKEVKNSLEIGRAVLVHGSPGVGKTEFMKGLAARYPEYVFFSFRNGEIFANGSWSSTAADKIADAFHEAEGYRQVVFCLDEFGDSFESSKNDLKAVLKPLLGDSFRKVRFIAATTSDQWKKISEDSAIQQRFHEIDLKATSPEQTQAILYGLALKLRKKVPISKKAIAKITELSGGNPLQAQPRNGLDTLRYLASKMEQFDPQTYTTEELRAGLDLLDQLKCKASLSSSPGKYVESILQIKEKIKGAEDLLQPMRNCAARLQKLYELKRQSCQERNRLVRIIAAGAAVSAHHRIKAQCLETLLLPLLRARIKELSRGLSKDIHVRLDCAVVEAHFAALKSQAASKEQESLKASNVSLA